jgi:hypothetical protein
VSVRFRITGTDLPGRRSGETENLHVGVQRGKEVLDLVPADADRAVFEFDVDVKAGRLAGPFIHGKPGERFIYLAWGDVGADGAFTMTRRAKLRVDALDPAALDGGTVEGRLSLTDARGGPVCATVRPPAIDWRAV